MTIALQAQHLTKRYGALVACDQVSLSLLPGEIHALIGPNGAGKSTLIHLLSGTIAPDAGKLLMGDRDLTRLSPHARVRAGLSRSYQITNIFKLIHKNIFYFIFNSLFKISSILSKS